MAGERKHIYRFKVGSEIYPQINTRDFNTKKEANDARADWMAHKSSHERIGKVHEVPNFPSPSSGKERRRRNNPKFADIQDSAAMMGEM